MAAGVRQAATAALFIALYSTLRLLFTNVKWERKLYLGIE